MAINNEMLSLGVATLPYCYLKPKTRPLVPHVEDKDAGNKSKVLEAQKPAQVAA